MHCIAGSIIVTQRKTIIKAMRTEIAFAMKGSKLWRKKLSPKKNKRRETCKRTGRQEIMKGIPQPVKPSYRICLNSNASLNPKRGSRSNSLIHWRHTVPSNTVPRETDKLKNQHMFVTITWDDGWKVLGSGGIEGRVTL